MATNRRECDLLLFGDKQIVNGKEKIIAKGIRPVYKTKGAAAADLTLPEDVTIPAGQAVKIDLWVGFDIPKGFCIKLYPRSSLLIKYNLIQPVSIIDSDYTGHVHAPLYNPTNEPITLERGTRVCQAMLEQVFDVVDWDHEDAARDQNGFGGTGR